MHELSIAMSIVDIACEEARRLGARRVRAIHLRLGPLSGVIRKTLESAYEMAVEGTAVAGAKLVIRDVELAVFCRRCDARRPAPSVQQVCCSVCGEPSDEIVSGRELEVVAMEVES